MQHVSAIILGSALAGLLITKYRDHSAGICTELRL